MRIKRGVAHVKHRKNILKKAKGFKWGRKNQIRKAKMAITRAGRHAARHRRLKKREFRTLWQIRINAAARLNGTTYSQLMHKFAVAKIAVDRKILSQLAIEHPQVFAALVAKVK
ncbi:MAG: 50S ribosomal protein L20 [Candidatus Kerfeldbacteria bacterium]|nr:50S ribosomal protein L20 [Candidatus Kerfeldbacteria bacterium]